MSSYRLEQLLIQAITTGAINTMLTGRSATVNTFVDETPQTIVPGATFSGILKNIGKVDMVQALVYADKKYTVLIAYSLDGTSNYYPDDTNKSSYTVTASSRRTHRLATTGGPYVTLQVKNDDATDLTLTKLAMIS